MAVVITDRTVGCRLSLLGGFYMGKYTNPEDRREIISLVVRTLLGIACTIGLLCWFSEGDVSFGISDDLSQEIFYILQFLLFIAGIIAFTFTVSQRCFRRLKPITIYFISIIPFFICLSSLMIMKHTHLISADTYTEKLFIPLFAVSISVTAAAFSVLGTLEEKMNLAVKNVIIILFTFGTLLITYTAPDFEAKDIIAITVSCPLIFLTAHKHYQSVNAGKLLLVNFISGVLTAVIPLLTISISLVLVVFFITSRKHYNAERSLPKAFCLFLLSVICYGVPCTLTWYIR